MHIYITIHPIKKKKSIFEQLMAKKVWNLKIFGGNKSFFKIKRKLWVEKCLEKKIVIDAPDY